MKSDSPAAAEELKILGNNIKAWRKRKELTQDELANRCNMEKSKSFKVTRDAALIIAAQKIEHHEIAAYGGLVQLAITMGLKRAADLLDKTLREEEQTDSLLTDIAESFINVKAEQEGSYSWQKQV